MFLQTRGTFPAVEPLKFWFWRYTDENGKKRVTRYRLTEDNARRQYGPTAEPVDGSLELRTPVGHTSDWLTRRKP
jgi:hypothetical protein